MWGPTLAVAVKFQNKADIYAAWSCQKSLDAETQDARFTFPAV